MAGRFVDNERARRAIVDSKANFLDRLMEEALFVAWLADIEPEMYTELTWIYPTARRATGTN